MGGGFLSWLSWGWWQGVQGEAATAPVCAEYSHTPLVTYSVTVTPLVESDISHTPLITKGVTTQCP